MRIKELVHGRHRIQQFVKINSETRRKEEQKTDHKALAVPMIKAAAIKEPAKRELPLFMEPVFKAKDFDPL
jgi:hypothetical protein